MQVIDRAGLDTLFHVLAGEGYTVVGPTVRDGAVVYDRLASSAQLPEGWTDEQSGGHYRLRRRADRALFGYAVGPASWKAFFHPPDVRLWRARRAARGFTLDADVHETPRYALIGVRACELRAIHLQDRVLRGGSVADPVYAGRRDGSFIVAVNCGSPGGTCFCASMGTGPAVEQGYDLVLTELVDTDASRFTIEVGSARGGDVLARVPRRAATPAETEAAATVVREAAHHMGRTLDISDLPGLLARSLEHPHWEEVAQRCLTCGNCTMVCPTCFCTRIEDTTDLTGEIAERWRRWDSCFTVDFSYLHGGSVRPSAPARYRQWLTHKLGTWVAQFGSPGCVGCGRCVTWCPVGIDLTREVVALRAAPRAPAAPLSASAQREESGHGGAR